MHEKLGQWKGTTAYVQTRSFMSAAEVKFEEPAPKQGPTKTMVLWLCIFAPTPERLFARTAILHRTWWGTICSFFTHPADPYCLFPSFQSHLRGDFPMPQDLFFSPLVSSPPWPRRHPQSFPVFVCVFLMIVASNAKCLEPQQWLLCLPAVHSWQSPLDLNLQDINVAERFCFCRPKFFIVVWSILGSPFQYISYIFCVKFFYFVKLF